MLLIYIQPILNKKLSIVYDFQQKFVGLNSLLINVLLINSDLWLFNCII